MLVELGENGASWGGICPIPRAPPDLLPALL